MEKKRNDFPSFLLIFFENYLTVHFLPQEINRRKFLLQYHTITCNWITSDTVHSRKYWPGLALYKVAWFSEHSNRRWLKCSVCHATFHEAYSLSTFSTVQSIKKQKCTRNFWYDSGTSPRNLCMTSLSKTIEYRSRQ